MLRHCKTCFFRRYIYNGYFKYSHAEENSMNLNQSESNYPLLNNIFYNHLLIKQPNISTELKMFLLNEIDLPAKLRYHFTRLYFIYSHNKTLDDFFLFKHYPLPGDEQKISNLYDLSEYAGSFYCGLSMHYLKKKSLANMHHKIQFLSNDLEEEFIQSYIRSDYKIEFQQIILVNAHKEGLVMFQQKLDKIKKVYDKGSIQELAFFLNGMLNLDVKSFQHTFFIKKLFSHFSPFYEKLSFDLKVNLLMKATQCNIFLAEMMSHLSSSQLLKYIQNSTLKNTPKVKSIYVSTTYYNYLFQKQYIDNAHDAFAIPSIKNLVDLYWSLSRSQYQTISQENLAIITQKIHDSYKYLQPGDVINVIYSKTIQQIVTGQFNFDDINFYIELLRKSDFFSLLRKNQKIACLLYQVFLFLEHKFLGKNSLFSSFPEEVCRYMKSIWKRESLKRYTYSEFEKKYLMFIIEYHEKKLFQNLEIQSNVLCEYFCVDYIIKPKTIIEFNFETHFFGEKIQSNYLLKLETLKLLGYRICMINLKKNVPYNDEYLKNNLFKVLDNFYGSIPENAHN